MNKWRALVQHTLDKNTLKITRSTIRDSARAMYDVHRRTNP